jgi:ABC-type amino acid transport system permease subunit
MATATALATVDTMVDTIYSAMATATALATVDTVVDTLTTNLATVDTVVDGIAANMATATNLATVDTVVDGIVTTLASVPTLAQIEASTVLAKAAATTFLTKCVKNKKKVKVISGVLYLIIYDDDNVTEILRKAIKDVDGTDVPDPATGVIALETKSTV